MIQIQCTRADVDASNARTEGECIGRTSTSAQVHWIWIISRASRLTHVFNNFWSKIKWHVWLIRRGLVGVQYIKLLKVYLRLFLPQSTSPWVYIFIIKQFDLGSQTWDQSDHLALAPALVYKLTVFVWKSSVLNSNSNGNIFGLLYSSYLYFEWVKIASLCQCFCVFIFLSCAAKNSACHLGISRLLSCRFRGHDMTNKEYALRRGVQWTFSIHSAYLLKTNHKTRN